ncbi:MAG: hypothetical protein ACXWBS_04515, partial [Chthoniobacterales bacterium]
MSSYRVAPIFLIRAAGVPFDHLDRLATRETAAAARELLVRRKESGGGPEHAAMANKDFSERFERELNRARISLLESSRTVLPDYLVFGAGEFRDRLQDIANSTNPLPPRNARARERERHLLLYLQRVCAKNDTFSNFGPSAWGKVTSKTEGLTFLSDAGITKRDLFLERWTAHAVAAAINQDHEIKPELAPRLNPNGRLEKNEFVASETNERISLDPETLRALRQCDGSKPAYELPLSLEQLQQFTQQNIIRWQLEAAAMEPHAFVVLIETVRRGRDTPVRARWLDVLEPIAALPGCFGQTSDV